MFYKDFFESVKFLWLEFRARRIERETDLRDALYFPDLYNGGAVERVGFSFGNFLASRRVRGKQHLPKNQQRNHLQQKLHLEKLQKHFGKENST